MKKLVFFLIFNFAFNFSTAASEGLVQVPEQCFEKENAPCLVRALQDQFATTKSHVKFFLGANSLIKITQFPSAAFKLDIINGRVVIQFDSKLPFYLNTVSVGMNDIYYVKKSSEFVELYKANEARFLNIMRSGDLDLIETKDFASRKTTSDFINQFTNIPDPVYKLTMEKYEIQLKDEVRNQSRILQRKVAADESARRLDAEARQKQLIENKKLKDLFFMRTFKK